MYFNSSKVNCGSDASLDDLADNAFTVEAWVQLATDAAGIDVILAKGDSCGWVLTAHTVINQWQAGVACATTSAIASYPLTYDGKWHHLAFTWDDAGDRKVRLFLDGALVGTSIAGVGAIVSDAPYNLYFGVHGNGNSFPFKGGFGWVRLSDNLRYSGSFSPLPRCSPPAIDVHTIEQWNAQEGSGSILTASVNSPANDGALTNITWKTG